MESFELQSSKQIAKEIGRRAKNVRKSTGKTQKEFAEFSGIPLGTYSRFEQTGQLSLDEFIVVLQRLDRIDEIESILSPKSSITW